MACDEILEIGCKKMGVGPFSLLASASQCWCEYKHWELDMGIARAPCSDSLMSVCAQEARHSSTAGAYVGNVQCPIGRHLLGPKPMVRAPARLSPMHQHFFHALPPPIPCVRRCTNDRHAHPWPAGRDHRRAAIGTLGGPGAMCSDFPPNPFAPDPSAIIRHAPCTQK